MRTRAPRTDFNRDIRAGGGDGYARVVWLLCQTARGQRTAKRRKYVHRIGRTTRGNWRGALSHRATNINCCVISRKVAEKDPHALRRRAMSRTRRLKRADSEWSSAARRRQSWTRTKIREERAQSAAPRRARIAGSEGENQPRTGETRWRQSPRRPRRITRRLPSKFYPATCSGKDAYRLYGS